MPQRYNQLKSDPFSLLGMHFHNGKHYFRAYCPFADTLEIINQDTQESFSLPKDQHGFFYLELKNKFPYKLRYTVSEHSWEAWDAYSFPPIISEFDLHLFSEGTHRRTWEILGAHEMIVHDREGVFFAVWAPNAKSVRLVGEFTSWNAEQYFMRPRGLSGIWEIFIPEINAGTLYKYAIETQNGELLEKSDPYAFYAEYRPNTASQVYNITGYQWGDEQWMETRTQNINQPMSIYECHLGTWLKNGEQSLKYSEIASPLAEYLNTNGFTHVEFMPIMEYPYDGSWGYQVTGYFAPTARYGNPTEFMYLVDCLHQHGIGVILDWVPAHFPADAHGLARFDGTALYEYQDPREGWHPDWSTHIFNFDRTEVREFLISSALFWLEVYHIDGLRVDAVASMLYRDYSRNEGEWIPNRYGGRENIEAITFLQSLNTEIQRYHPTAMTIAEESTSFPKVTASPDENGLGFTYKWNMGWMNDTLLYFKVDPLYRSWYHNQLTFSLMYSFSERFILPFSHDEVVHGKKTLLNQMAGSEWEKFANLRLMFVYMWLHPGKKLLFAGQEWASLHEWNERNNLEWDLNYQAEHEGIRYLVHDLNHIYQHEKSLFLSDHDPDGFFWIDCDNTKSGLLMWVRCVGEESLVIILNLTPIVKEKFRIGVPYQANYDELLNSDYIRYGGAQFENSTQVAQDLPWQNMPYSIEITIGPLAALVFKVRK